MKGLTKTGAEEIHKIPITKDYGEPTVRWKDVLQAYPEAKCLKKKAKAKRFDMVKFLVDEGNSDKYDQESTTKH
jgi:hypothetical protein